MGTGAAQSRTTAVPRIAALVCALACWGVAAAEQERTVWAAAAEAYDLDPLALYAVALQESRTTRPDGTARPWPWTLRSARDGPRRYEDFADAREALEGLLADGERNVDVGLMQINWGINGGRVGSPAELLDPHRNVFVGAAILREALTAQNGDLARALAAYHHRPESARGQRYSADVRRRLDRLRRVPGLAQGLSGNARAAQGPTP